MSVKLKAIIAMMKLQPKLAIGPGTDYPAMRKAMENPKMQMPMPKGVTVEARTMAGVEVECLSPEQVEDENLIFYIHGGGYVYGNAFTSRPYAAMLADACKMRVFTISYRLAPEHKFPAGSDDCFGVYRALLETYPGKNIALIGGSTGGNLVLSTALRAKDEGLQLPACVFAQSPSTNMADQLPSRGRNKDKDLVVPYENLNEILVSEYLDDEADAKNPYVSPYFGDYEGFPPLKVTVDENEVLFDDADMLVKKAREAGVEVEYEIMEGTFHGFPEIGTCCPESQRILDETAAYVHKMCKRQAGRGDKEVS